MLIWDWIKSKLFHETNEVKPMSDISSVGSSAVDGQAYIATGGILTIGDQPQTAPEPQVITNTVTINAVEADLDAFYLKVVALLKVAGHDVSAVADEVRALAKKI